MSERTDAIEALIRQGRADRLTKKGYRSVNAACRKLELTNDETDDILRYLEYHGSDGTPRAWLLEKKLRKTS